MKRRSAIKNLVIIAGGITIFPSCSGDPAKASIELSHLDISAEDEALLADIVETIIPQTANAPGAKDLNLHLFTLKMANDCHTKEEQQKFTAGLKAFDAFVREKTGAGFSKMNAEQRLTTVSGLLEDGNATDVQTFLKITKRRVIQGFTHSKFVMSDMKQYELVPGRYNGFFPVNS
ncbi:MAG: gluconate 2-dehydrogenase subunit 3 family protein [Chitinophagaceae bacterium]|nr:gluconate 2-dehydrogenase subunit 3 family protein [Chitinophagaceae bacterium]MCW5925995.1 gluconate 2-dehydrogenase subunit 3 family protein [Chitinophagaceae bacterium]